MCVCVYVCVCESACACLVCPVSACGKLAVWVGVHGCTVCACVRVCVYVWCSKKVYACPAEPEVFTQFTQKGENEVGEKA